MISRLARMQATRHGTRLHMRLLLQMVAGLFGILPRGAAMALGRGLGGLAGSLLRLRRREVEAVMRRALPASADAERCRLAGAMYRHLGQTLAEVLRAGALGAADLESRVVIADSEPLRAMAARPDGGLLLMGHIGNWECCSLISRVLPRPLHAVVKPLKPPAVQAFMQRVRGSLGLRLLGSRGDFAGTLRALKRGEYVCVILDQNAIRGRGVFVEFLGETASTTTGLAILSAMSRLPVFPLYDHRRPDGVHEVHVLPPIDPPPNRKPETLLAATQQYTRVLEDLIRRHPEQWMWLHRRWKTRPRPGDLVVSAP